MARQLKPIKPKRIADQVFDQLHDLVLRAEFKPGEKIMTERELSEAFQVSRTSIRSAVNKLVVMGILEQRQGQGTFVRQPGGGTHSYMAGIMESHNATMRDLLEVRMGIECNGAALAAKRARPADIEFLEMTIAEIETQVKAGRLGSHADARFHMAIAFATHNPLQIFIMKQFYDFLAYGIRENLFALDRESIDSDTVHRQHIQIMTAIKNHDAPKAYTATKHHIEQVIRIFENREPAAAADQN